MGVEEVKAAISSDSEKEEKQKAKTKKDSPVGSPVRNNWVDEEENQQNNKSVKGIFKPIKFDKIDLTDKVTPS